MNKKEAMQSMFDTALAHIRKQGKPSVDYAGDCAYKGENGLSCAFAPFIITYTDSMEGMCPEGLLQDYPNHLDPVCKFTSRQFKESIQECHDLAVDSGRDFLTDYEGNMSDLADKYELDYSPC